MGWEGSNRFGDRGQGFACFRGPHPPSPLRPLRLSSWGVGFAFWFGMLVLWAVGWAPVAEADRQTALGNLLRAQDSESSQTPKLSTGQTE